MTDIRKVLFLDYEPCVCIKSRKEVRNLIKNCNINNNEIKEKFISCVSEAVQNAYRYGGKKEIIIDIWYNIEDKILGAKISDQGDGFDFQAELEKEKAEICVDTFNDECTMHKGLFIIFSQADKLLAYNTPYGFTMEIAINNVE